MSMRGIDISNWQGGIDLKSILPQTDFVICKSTGGISFVDDYCDEWIQTCKEYDKPWGFYHFGHDIGYAPAYDEANFFIDNCYDYFGHGIPILDWERDSIDDEWVNTFVNIVHSETGIWCWIYANPWRITEKTEPNCGRWVAAYPSNLLYPDLYVELPEPPEVDGLMCAWQFASDCRIPGYNGNLDASIFYGDREAWEKYAGCWNDSSPAKPDIYTFEDDNYKITIERKK